MKITSKKIILSTIFSIVLSIITPITAFADEDDPINSITNSSTQPSSETAKPLSKKSQDAIANMLMQSVSLMGIAYKWGGNTPTTGLDCSGFVRYVYQNSLGINLPRTAAEQAKVGKRISIDNLEPGDLIFFNTKRGSNTHVGIYIGDNKFIQSPRTGENIQISDLSGNWRKNFNGAKRIVQENEDGDNGTELQNFQNVRDEALPVSSRAFTKKQSKKKHGTKITSKKGKSKSTTKSVKKSNSKSSNSKTSSSKKKKKKS